jgi:predicted Zn-dependent protease
MLNETEIRNLLHHVLARSQATETEVVFLGLEEALTRFANNEIHQNVAETQGVLAIRVALGKRVAALSTNALDEAGVERALEQALALAKLQPENPYFPGFTPPAPLPAWSAAYDEATAAATPEYRAQAVGAVLRYALEKEVNASGAFRTSRYAWAVANSHGLFAYTPTTLADLTIVAMTATSSGYAADAAWHVDAVDVAARGREAVDKALKAQNPRPVAPGDYPVVLEPYAAQDFLDFLVNAAGAMGVEEGQSWMSGRQGEPLMSPAITVVDDATDPALWPMPFDFEGMPRQRVEIVRQGVVGDAVYDRLWAGRTGKVSTGHALPPFNPFAPQLAMGVYGPVPVHPIMAPGDAELPAMIAGVERGIYVTRFNYTRLVHPRDVIVTGLTRDGTFWIENGELAYPVKNLRFTQSYVEALQQVVAVGRQQQNERGYFSVGRAPALSLGRFRFTGATTF